MNWYRRWKSRREESRRGRLTFDFPWKFYGGIILLIILIASPLVWVAVHCRAWQTIEQDTVIDKEYREWYTTRCVSRNSDGNCYAYTTEHHEVFVLKFRNGDAWRADEQTYNTVRVGDTVTYPKDHFACDK